MFYLRFLAGAGGVLLALLFAVNALTPTPDATVATQGQTFDHPTIRITSTRKGPERVVFDTSLPTIVTEHAPVADNAAPAQPQGQTREAFAQLPTERPAQPVAAAKDARQSRKPHRHIAASRPYGRQYIPSRPSLFAGGFFSPWWIR